MSNDRYHFVLALRAIRQYRDEPLAPEHLTAILEAARWTGSAKNRQDWSFIVIQDREQLEKVAECGDHTDPLRNSAAAIVIVAEPGGYEFDSGRLAQNIMLAASALGVASCPITLHRDDDAARVLGVAGGRKCRYAVALGYPAPQAGPAHFGGRKPLDELVHWERY
jgi:nitroreductase